MVLSDNTDPTGNQIDFDDEFGTPKIVRGKKDTFSGSSDEDEGGSSKKKKKDKKKKK